MTCNSESRVWWLGGDSECFDSNDILMIQFYALEWFSIVSFLERPIISDSPIFLYFSAPPTPTPLICVSIFSLLCLSASSALTPPQATSGGEVKVITSPYRHSQRTESHGSNCTNWPIRGQRDRAHSAIASVSLFLSLSPLFSQSEGRHFGQLYNPFTCNNELLLFLHFAFIWEDKSHQGCKPTYRVWCRGTAGSALIWGYLNKMIKEQSWKQCKWACPTHPSTMIFYRCSLDRCSVSSRWQHIAELDR